MFIDGQKALVISGSPEVCRTLGSGLPFFYNLQVETAADGTEAIKTIGGQSRPYEVVIIDDGFLGLERSSDIYRAIRRQCLGTTVFFLSTLKEWEHSPADSLLPDSIDASERALRRDRASTRLRKMTDLCRPLFHNTLSKGIYQDVCRRMVEIFNVEIGIVALKDTIDEYRVVIVEQFPRANGRPRFFQMDFNRVPSLENLIKHFRPVHFTSDSELGEMGPVLEKLLGSKPESLLLVPLICRGQSIGFTGLFNRRPGGTFSLEDIDLCLRFTDTLARSFCRGFSSRSR